MFLDAVKVRVKEVGGVEGPAFGFGVELGGEDGAGFVDHACAEKGLLDSICSGLGLGRLKRGKAQCTFVTGVIEVDEILFPLAWEGG